MAGFVSAFVRINEIMYNPDQGSDSFNEWIEIFNNGTSSVNLTDATLCGDSLLKGFLNKSDGNIGRNTTFILQPSSFAVITDGGSGGDVGTDVYINFNVDSDALALHTSEKSICSGGLKNTGEEINIALNTESHIVDYQPFVSFANGNNKTLIFYKGTFTESAIVNGTPGASNDQFAPDFNKWINPSVNDSFAQVRLNITVNITDVTNVNTSLVNFNGTNFSMTKSGDIWYYVWDISKSIDKVHNITVYFNDSNDFVSSDTIFNLTVDNSPPKYCFQPARKSG